MRVPTSFIPHAVSVYDGRQSSRVCGSEDTVMDVLSLLDNLGHGWRDPYIQAGNATQAEGA